MEINLEDIEWIEAKGKDLSDHIVGDLCKDADGNIFLIGHVDGDYDIGCGCCSERHTEADIVSYYSAIKIMTDLEIS